MIHLINNYCIKKVFDDENGGENTGEIHFIGGEIYSGEISNKLPLGFGTLRMKDGSYYQGQFDGKAMSEGTFYHFTGTKFEGKFSRDRLRSGKMIFPDGDELKGEWCMKRGKWSIKKGTLIDSDGKTLFKFDKKSEKSFKSNLKTVWATYEDYGFSVIFEHFLDIDGEIYNPLVITAECNCYFEKKPSKEDISQHNLMVYTQIPYTKREHYKKEEIIKTVYNICFGLTLEKDLKKNLFKLIFDDVKKIHAVGCFEFERIKLLFKGSLFYEENNKAILMGKIMIKKTTFGKLKIEYNNNTFDNLKILKETLKKEKPVEVIEAKRTLSTSSESLPIMGDIISDIKQHENCRIF